MIRIRDIVMAQANERLERTQEDIDSILSTAPMDITDLRNLNECLDRRRRLQAFVTLFPTGKDYDRATALELLEERLELEEAYDD